MTANLRAREVATGNPPVDDALGDTNGSSERNSIHERHYSRGGDGNLWDVEVVTHNVLYGTVLRTWYVQTMSRIITYQIRSCKYYLRKISLLEAIMDTINDRMLLIINEKTNERRRWKELEELSGIAATSWQNFDRERQRAMGEMIEAVSRAWPQHAFWLATGLTDPESGHVAPTVDSGYPNPGAPLETSSRYFKDALEAKEVAREYVMEWWHEELGEDLDGLTESLLLNDLLLRNARNILVGRGNVEDAKIAKLDSATSKMNISSSLRKAEIMLETERELDYEQTEELVNNIERMKKNIEKKARIRKINVDFDVIDEKMNKLKERIMRYKKFNKLLMQGGVSGSKED